LARARSRPTIAGEALTPTQPEDADMVRQIEKVLGAPLERRRLPGFNYEGFDPESRPREVARARPAARPEPRRAGPAPRRPGHAGQSRSRRRAGSV
jgi:ATP-dependent RNA helicase RhlE